MANTTAYSLKFGFTLLEILVATTIMIMIVVMVANMFRNASESWDTGTQSAEMNTAARAALEYISRELSCAVAGSMPSSTGGVATLKPFQLIDGNEFSFVAFPVDEGALCGVRFKFEKFMIVTTDEPTGFQPYAPTWSPSWTPDLLISNVWRFEAGAYSNEEDMAANRFSSSYDSSANSNLLPACVDLAVEMLNARDSARAMSLDGPDDDPNSPRCGFVMTNSRVYTTRVYFPNRGAK